MIRRLLLSFCIIAVNIVWLSHPMHAQSVHQKWSEIQTSFFEQESTAIESSMTFLYRTPETQYNTIIRFHGHYGRTSENQEGIQGKIDVIIKNLLVEEHLNVSANIRLINNRLYWRILSLSADTTRLTANSKEIIGEISNFVAKQWYGLNLTDYFPSCLCDERFARLGMNHLFFGRYHQHSVRNEPNILFTLNRSKIRQILNFVEDERYNWLKEGEDWLKNVRYFNWFFMQPESNIISRLRGIFKYSNTPDLLMILSYNIHFENFKSDNTVAIPTNSISYQL